MEWTVVQICISFCDIHLNTAGLEAALMELMPASITATTQGTCMYLPHIAVQILSLKEGEIWK